MKRFLLSLLCMTIVMCSVSAQVLKGDMNGDGILTVEDLTSMVNHILNNKTEYIETGATAANSDIEGTWYVERNDFITFGNTSNSTIYGGTTYSRYVYYPALSIILIYGEDDSVKNTLVVKSKTDTSMTLLLPDGVTKTYSTTCPPSNISAEYISFEAGRTSLFAAIPSLRVVGETTTIEAHVYPLDADVRDVEWTITHDTSPNTIQIVSENGNSIKIQALRMPYETGGATITATAKDGSGVSRSIHISTKSRPRYTAVDLGLPSGLKWADCNVGASSPEETGLYYAWGEIDGYVFGSRSFDLNYYKWYDSNSETITKYNDVDNKTTLEPEDDAASVFCGGTWRMPTVDEMEELYRNCTWTKTTVNNKRVYKVEGKNGNYIYMPTSYDYYYWTSSLSTYSGYGISGYAYWDYAFSIGIETRNINDSEYRSNEFFVRAVCP